MNVLEMYRNFLCRNADILTVFIFIGYWKMRLPYRASLEKSPAKRTHFIEQFIKQLNKVLQYSGIAITLIILSFCKN
jgi:hypothetical protein